MCLTTAVCPEMRSLAGNTYILDICRSVLDIKVRACRQFQGALPPDIAVLSDGSILHDDLPAPSLVSVIFSERDRSKPAFWDAAFVAYAKFGDRRESAACIEELEKHEHDYASRKFLDSARSGDLVLVNELLASKVDIDCSNCYGMTALMIAAEMGNIDIVRVLREGSHHANAYIADCWGMTALMYAAHRGRTEIVRLLNSPPLPSVFLNAVSGLGHTALSLAAKRGSVEMLTFLHEQGASLDTLHEHGDTVVGCALIEGKIDNAEYLLSLGVPLGRTALVCAVLSEECSAVRFVLALDHTLRDEVRNGVTALEVAQEEGLADIIDLLQ